MREKKCYNLFSISCFTFAALLKRKFEEDMNSNEEMEVDRAIAATNMKSWPQLHLHFIGNWCVWWQLNLNQLCTSTTLSMLTTLYASSSLYHLYSQWLLTTSCIFK